MSAPYDEHIGTHWEGCETERNHHQCALARLEEARRERDEYSCAMMDEEKAKNALTAQLAAAQAENERLRELMRFYFGAFSNFYAMVEGECPSLIEDDHNALRAEQAIESLRAALQEPPR